MDHTYPDLRNGRGTVSAEGVVCCCSGGVIPIMDAAEWSEFAFGQLVALGVGTFVLALATLALSLLSTGKCRVEEHPYPQVSIGLHPPPRVFRRSSTTDSND